MSKCSCRSFRSVPNYGPSRFWWHGQQQQLPHSIFLIIFPICVGGMCILLLFTMWLNTLFLIVSVSAVKSNFPLQTWLFAQPITYAPQSSSLVWVIVRSTAVWVGLPAFWGCARILSRMYSSMRLLTLVLFWVVGNESNNVICVSFRLR